MIQVQLNNNYLAILIILVIIAFVSASYFPSQSLDEGKSLTYSEYFISRGDTMFEIRYIKSTTTNKYIRDCQVIYIDSLSRLILHYENDTPVHMYYATNDTNYRNIILNDRMYYRGAAWFLKVPLHLFDESRYSYSLNVYMSACSNCHFFANYEKPFFDRLNKKGFKYFQSVLINKTHRRIDLNEDSLGVLYDFIRKMPPYVEGPTIP